MYVRKYVYLLWQLVRWAPIAPRSISPVSLLEYQHWQRYINMRARCVRPRKKDKEERGRPAEIYAQSTLSPCESLVSRGMRIRLLLNVLREAIELTQYGNRYIHTYIRAFKQADIVSYRGRFTPNNIMRLILKEEETTVTTWDDTQEKSKVMLSW